MDSMADGEKPHAVCVPFPYQGHINPMLKLAKLLHHRGFHITFVNTEFNHNRLMKSRGPNSLDGISSFHFETIPDGLPPSNADATQDLSSLGDSTSKNCLPPFRELLFKLNDTASSKVPPVTCIVADSVMTFTLTTAQELGIPGVLFVTSSACGFMGYVQFRDLIDKGFFPLKDVSDLSNGYLETVLDWIPCMEGVRLKDLPSFLRTTDPNDIVYNFALREVERNRDASAVMFNTFDNLEHNVLEALSSTYPPIFTIGPLPLLLNQITDNDLKSIGSNLWKEEPGCLEWLDSKDLNSVVYVNFGSVTVMTPQQLIEFAWGLCNSMQSFLWVIRPNVVIGDSAILPLEFMHRTKEKGMLVNWCPQEDILGHQAIGGFLTHCGWNSTLESMCCGVPMICWPFFAEQQTNCWYCCDKWGIGMEVGTDVKRDEVEVLVRKLMQGKEGKQMKKEVMKWKAMAFEATTGPTGSSYLNFEKMVTQVLLPKYNYLPNTSP